MNIKRTSLKCFKFSFKFVFSFIVIFVWFGLHTKRFYFYFLLHICLFRLTGTVTHNPVAYDLFYFCIKMHTSRKIKKIERKWKKNKYWKAIFYDVFIFSFLLFCVCMFIFHKPNISIYFQRLNRSSTFSFSFQRKCTLHVYKSYLEIKFTLCKQQFQINKTVTEPTFLPLNLAYQPLCI